MGRIFGTDGARGVVGKELTAELAVNIGRAAAMVLIEELESRPLVAIGMDTRISGDMLQSAVAAGLCSVGANVLLLGVVPTPAVAYLVEKYNAHAGVMLSASHNPYEFNGIKLFGPKGFKLTDQEEDRIEAIILDGAESYNVKTGGELGRIFVADNAVEDYVNYISATYKGGFEGKVLVDCANGSASATAKLLFEKLNINADFIHCEPNGVNINKNCGSTHVENLSTQVVENGYYLGLAFDGDADRLLAVDEKGNILDGDVLLAVLAKYLTAENRLKNNTVVATTMSNLGFIKLMKSRNIAFELTGVGDRYVLENMRSNGHVLGGEQSGHIIMLEHSTTGDGQLSAVMLLNAIAALGQSPSDLAQEMQKFPQTMLNVSATPAMKKSFEQQPLVIERISHWQNELGELGRVIVRPSGTEPYIRVMVEGESFENITTAAKDIAEAIRQYLI